MKNITTYTGEPYDPEQERQALIACMHQKMEQATLKQLRLINAATNGIME